MLCPGCQSDVVGKITTKKENIRIRGEKINVTCQTRVCNICGSDIHDAELREKNIKNAENVYRHIHSMLFPEDIALIRKSYGLSQRLFSVVIGFGVKTIMRYERGALPDEAHNNLIITLRDPKIFIDIWNRKRHLLSDGDNAKISHTLSISIKDPNLLRYISFGFQDRHSSKAIMSN
ncbi:MAG: type II toxin-antitoxin system MqsA family antitoxin [Herbinix sp.]|nr:type II toxin-antitoxin system MqsA family antitoxin [Herbinix sp.]